MSPTPGPRAMSEKLFAHFLLSRGNPLAAERELECVLAKAPDDASAHSLLALVLLTQGVVEKARWHSDRALALEPGLAYSHYVQSFTRVAHLKMLEIPFFGTTPNDGFALRKAIKDIQEAIRLNPEDAAFHVRLAELQSLRSRWKRGLAAADVGLSCDPDSVPAAIWRAEALNRLGRRLEARKTLNRALATNPEASDAHAGLGWALLEAGEDRKAESFFNEALRLRPMSAWAQEGLLETARRRFRVYRWISKWRFWRNSLPLLVRGPLNLATFLIFCCLPVYATEPLKSSAYFKPISILIFSAAMLAFVGWLHASSIFAWLVRRDSAGRSSVAEAQRVTGKTQLAVLAASLAAIVIFIVAQKAGREVAWGIGGLAPGALAVWIASRFPPTKARRWAYLYASLVLAAGVPVALALEQRWSSLPPGGFLFAFIVPSFPLALRQQMESKQHSEKLREEAKQRLK